MFWKTEIYKMFKMKEENLKEKNPIRKNFLKVKEKKKGRVILTGKCAFSVENKQKQVSFDGGLFFGASQYG